MLRHDAAAKVIDHNLDLSPPLVVLETQGSQSLLDNRAEIAASLGRSLAVAKDISASLSEAHRLGMVHGSMGPLEVRFTAEGRTQIDFSGLRETRSNGSAENAPLFDAGEEADASLADGMSNDVLNTGRLLVWLFTGEALPTGQTEACRERLRQWSRRMHAPDGALNELAESLADSLSSDPERRPLAADLNTAIDRAGHYLSETLGVQAADLETSPGGQDTMEVGRLADLEQTGAPTVAGQSRNHAALESGSELGRFRILQKLGQGGMGAVYKAEDKASGGTVAIKVMKPGMSSDHQALQRFRKEARLLAQSQNPYLANLIEVNHDGGFHYIAMEYIGGADLQQYLAAHSPLEERVAVGIAADVARALVERASARHRSSRYQARQCAAF